MKHLVLLAALAVCACGRDEDQINCDDLLPPEETSYRELALIITSEEDPRNCAQCHKGNEPARGLNLETPQSAYFTLRDRIDRVYANVATGEMPEDGLEWGDAELRLLRSWYCRGAFYD
ncbi:MAG: hypothetical protein ACAI38_19890 [Myxococcota bacterium]